MLRIGIIGFGGRVGHLALSLPKLGICDVDIAAVADIRTRDEIAAAYPDARDLLDRAAWFADYGALLAEGNLDGVMIGTRCSTHAEIAHACMARDIPVFLEKPVATTLAQWALLRDGYERHDARTVVSFPLRVSPLLGIVREIIDSGRLGTIEHVLAFNYVPYGGVYYHGWYRDERETGGLFLQKATHDFDYLNFLLGQDPVDICAMGSKRIFAGTRPAGLHCVDCDAYRTCSDSPYVLERYSGDSANGDMCAFAVDTGNHDSGSALIRYSSGLHAAYTQNFFARKKTARRGAILSGYRGTVEFDWYRDEILVRMHHTNRIDTIRMEDSMHAHFGGDPILMANFLGVAAGREASIAPLRCGLVSARMSLAATESEKDRQFHAIDRI